MIKTLLTYLSLLLLPLFALAQTEPQVLEDFAKSIKAINTFAFNDKLNIIQVSVDDENFELIAVNEKMQVIWRTPLAGYGIKTDKFKNKIVALASADHSTFKGTNNTFVAYIVDPANGKVLANKAVYKSSDDYVEFPQLYTGNGEFFKLAVRQTGFRRKMHVGIPIYSFFTFNNYIKEYNETRNLQVVEYDDKLDSVSAFKPVISNGVFISLAWNKHADLFISWLNGPSIEVYKYDAGKTAPSNQLTVPIGIEMNKNFIAKDKLFMQPADDNSNVLYYSLIYSGQESPELGIGKFDFATNKTSYAKQEISKNILKAIKKSFVPLNKDLDDVDLGAAGGMNIKYMNETNGNVIITLASNYTVSSNNGSYMGEDALLINGFNRNLELKYQQVLPANSMHNRRFLQTGYHIKNNKLYVLANAKKGMRTISGVFGVMDMATGKWDQMRYLPKKNIGNSDFADGPSILWFGKGFIVPYISPKTFSITKMDLSLQLNDY